MRGINLVGMEGEYGWSDEASDQHFNRGFGPEAGRHYPVHSPKLIDYFKNKGIDVIKLLFSWDRMQSDLWGPVPGPGPGYRGYYTHFKEVVDYVTSRGIVVIIQPWQLNGTGDGPGATWQGRLIGSPDVDLSAFVDFWAKLTTAFKDNELVEYSIIAEPNHMSTMAWWTIAQKCIDAIRAAGATTTIYVPGNGYTAAASWTEDWYDTATPRRSNAFGWLNVNADEHGNRSPLHDPLQKSVAEVHVYLDEDGGGSQPNIMSPTIASERLSVAVDEAAARGYRLFVGEIGFYANAANADAAWTDFISYIKANPLVCTGFTWWAGGTPGWWDDVGAHDGGHYSITPTQIGKVYSGDTVNMTMIEKDFT